MLQLPARLNRKATERSISTMIELTRRRVLVGLAVTLAGLGIRRAVARPDRIQPPLAERGATFHQPTV